MAHPLPDRPLGVYVHVPWCTHLCPYCDFAVVVRPLINHTQYLKAILTELRGRADTLPDRQLRSIYFGGGTPSLWEASAIKAVVDEVSSTWAHSGDLEITVECNPEQDSPETYQALIAAGVNRVSIGTQSFSTKTLASLGRRHTPAQNAAAIRHARAAGINRISGDLIFGADGQTQEHWRADLNALTQVDGIGHVSLYQLTIEPNTVFGRLVAKDKMPAPDADTCARFYEMADEVLIQSGFQHYEVSSWARPGQQSRHNNLYWSGAEYMGLGVGAHSLRFSTDGTVLRGQNGRKLKSYLANPLGEQHQVETIDERTHLSERMMTGLRTSLGVDMATLRTGLELDVDTIVEPIARTLIAQGLLEREEGYLRPTPRGLRLGDHVAEQFFE